MKKHINTLFFLFCAVAAIAQAPQKFNYQAVARNAQSAIMPNQNIKIRASILDGSANGTSKYIETHSATTNQLGLFNLAIGGGVVVSGNFTNISWASGDKYLKIEMDATGGNNFSLVGTSQLLSVPYALNAGNGSQWKNISGGISYTTNIGQDLQISSSTPFIQNTPSIITSNDNLYFDINRVWTRNLFTVIPDTPSINSNHLNLSAFEGYGQIATRLPGSTLAFQTDVNGGNVGVGTIKATSKLQIKGGDVYIEDVNNGVIMKSPNGQCWRLTVSNAGLPVFTAITCP